MKNILDKNCIGSLINQFIHSDYKLILDILPEKSINHICIDPPYGLGNSTFNITPEKRGNYYNKGKFTKIKEEWDKFVPLSWMKKSERILQDYGSIFVFSGKLATSKIITEAVNLKWRLINEIVLVKSNPMPNMTGRLMRESTERLLWFCPMGTKWTYKLDKAKILGNGRNLSDVWNFSPPKHGRWHPAQKPIDTLITLLEIGTNPGDVILDFFCGSGTTGLACLKTNRKFICSDFKEEYISIARNRAKSNF